MPPLSGQSGTGICKDINGKQYVIGIITWNNGNRGSGVALKRLHEVFKKSTSKVDKIPTSFEYVSVCKYCGKNKEDHFTKHTQLNTLELSNGQPKLYCQEVICPICGKSHRFGPFSPRNPREPIYPDNNDDLPNILLPEDTEDEEPEEDLQSEIDKLSKQIQDLQKDNDAKIKEIRLLENRISLLEIEKLNLQKQLDSDLISDNTQILELKKQNLELKEQTRSIEQAHQKVLDEISAKHKIQVENFQEQLNELKKKDCSEYLVQINELKIQLSNMTLKISQIQEENELLHKKNKELLDLLDKPIDDKNDKEDGILGTFIKLNGQLFGLGKNIISSIWNFIKKILFFLGVCALFLFAFISIRDVFSTEIEEKCDDNYVEKNNNEQPDLVYNNIEGEYPPQPLPADYLTNTKVNQRGRDIVQLKNRDGENLIHLATLGKLYKKAISLLRYGKLDVKPGVRIIGGIRAAETIENWVINQFAEALSTENIKFLKANDLHREALYGVLYKEAIMKLKQGHFEEVLNFGDVADVLEDYVNREIIKYIEE